MGLLSMVESVITFSLRSGNIQNRKYSINRHTFPLVKPKCTKADSLETRLYGSTKGVLEATFANNEYLG